jgi:hypothetical protein
VPSPFPGMDPWLERPTIWQGVHHGLIEVIREQLVPQLLPRYAVDTERRVYVLEEGDPGQRAIIPDLSIMRSGSGSRPAAVAADITAPSATAETTVAPVEVREARVVILALPERRVVTVVEVLSPTNKTPGSRGREEYLAKRREVLRSETNLVEVDLLRGGRRVVEAEGVPDGDYQAHVSRRARRPAGDVWVWGLRDALPRIPVPLRAGDPDAVLDLGAALTALYDRGGYSALADYEATLEPPLSPADAAWAAERLAAR